MAVAIDLSNEVLHAFANSHRHEMTLIELHKVLSTQFMRITTDEVLRTVRSSSLVNLFNLQPISNDLCLIQLNPKVRRIIKTYFICFYVQIVNSLRSVLTKRL
jgi:hypothetical protein